MTGSRGAATTARGADKGVGAQINELIGLVVAYAKQETVVPIKNLGRYLAAGLGGILLFSIGGVFATVAALRVVQTETGHHLRGDLSWVPYLGGAVVALAGIGWAASRIARRKM